MTQQTVMKVADIKPYADNPRRIPEDAVEAVRYSIENLTYVQPIVVDTDGVVIVGHTRLQAIKQLGYEEVEVWVSNLPKDKAREYRLADNRTGEMSSWDHNSLVIELREAESAYVESFFPDLDLEVGLIQDQLVTQGDVEKAQEKVSKVKEVDVAPTTQVECPVCYRTFEVRTDSLPGVTDGGTQ